jgi:hypothetical protein
VPFCSGSPGEPSCPEGLVCGYDLTGTLALCRTQCDPLAQDCPHPRSACRDVNDHVSFGCYTDASGGVSAEPNSVRKCWFVNDCRAGEVCLADERVSTYFSYGLYACTPFCNTLEPDTCPFAEQDCVAWTPGAMGDAAEIGACLLP